MNLDVLLITYYVTAIKFGVRLSSTITTLLLRNPSKLKNVKFTAATNTVLSDTSMTS